MIAETIAIVSAANAAIGQIKTLAGHGRDLASMGKQIGLVVEAEERLRAEGNSKKNSIWTKAFGAKDGATVEEFFQLEQMKQNRREMESHFKLYGRPGLWNDYVKFETELRVKRRKDAEAREKARRELVQTVYVTVGVSIFVGGVAALFWWSYNNRVFFS